jgi:hypothetical protein
MSAVLVEAGPDKDAIWHFGQPSHEQRALYEGRAWADLSHRAVLTVTGEDRRSWLNNLTTQELVNWQSNEWTTALILDAQGHIQHQLFLFDDGVTTWIHTERDAEAALIAFLEKMVFMLRVDPQVVTDRYAVIRVPGAADNLGGPYEIVERGNYAEKYSDFTQVGTWALEAERVAQGRARLHWETDYKSIPNELGFLGSAVHMRKGCYPGQETVAKVFNLGQPPRRIVMLHLDGSDSELPPHGAKVFLADKEVGFLGTSARHYELGPIALAVVKRNTPLDATLTVDGVAANQEEISRPDSPSRSA